MADRPVRPPKIRPPVLDGLTPGAAAGIEAHTTVDATRFAAEDVAGRDLSGVSFVECELVGWSADDTDFADVRFLQTRIERLYAPMWRVPRATLRECRVEDSRIGALEGYEARLHSVVVTGSKLGLLNLRGADLRDVVFEDCLLEELDLGEARATRVAFRNCTVARIDCTRADLTDVDLRGLDIAAVRGIDGMRGATLTGVQAAGLAPALAAHLGVLVDG